jgi:hypothetical protein
MMENNVLKQEIQKLYDDLLIMNAAARDIEEEVWFDASENGYNVKVQSAADLQLLLHSSTIRNKVISVPMSRTGSSSRNLHYVTSFTSLRSASPDHIGRSPSPQIRNGERGIRVLERIMYEISKAANPGVGFVRGVFLSCFDFGRNLKRRNRADKPKDNGKYWRSGITILTVVTLTFIIARRVQKHITY